MIKKHCQDADIVHHLAGITDVPRVKNESSPEKEDLINKVAEEGTQNILDVISDKCKMCYLIFIKRHTGSIALPPIQRKKQSWMVKYLT